MLFPYDFLLADSQTERFLKSGFDLLEKCYRNRLYEFRKGLNLSNVDLKKNQILFYYRSFLEILARRKCYFQYLLRIICLFS